MFRKNKDIACGSFLLMLSAVVFIGSLSIRRLEISRIGAQFVPQVAAAGLALVALSIIHGGYKELKGQKNENASKGDEEKKEGSNNAPVIATFAAITAYVLLLDTLGFIIMTSVYLFAQFIILSGKNERKLPVFALVAIAASVTIYYVFLSAFHLMLPAGILG